MNPPRGILFMDMPYPTGSTIFEQVVSTDQTNAAVPGATFDTVLFKDGAANATPVTIALYDALRGIFNVSFVPTSYGQYQLYMKNNVTDVIFLSDIYDVSTGLTSTANIDVFVGL